MYAMIRTYEGVSRETADEVARRAFPAFRQRLAERPGFVAYELVIGDDAITAIGVFESWVIAEETSLLARRWIEETLAGFELPEPRITAGEVYAEPGLPPPFAPPPRTKMKRPLQNLTEEKYL